MRKGFLLIVMIAAMGCGGGSGNVPDGAAGQCNPSASCVSCIKLSCDSQAKAAFGAGYQSGNFSGGACPNFLACTCNKSGMESVCAQQDGANCATAFAALGDCLDTATCFDSTCKGNSSSGLTVNGNAMAFGNTQIGSAPLRCMLVTGPNASSIMPQVLNDTGCAAGGCAFSTEPLYCRAPDSCDACVVFAPRVVGAVTATLSIASGLNVALSGVGTMSTIPSTGGIVGFGGVIGTGGRTGAGGSTSLATGGTTTISTVDASTGTGGNIGIDGSVDINGAGGIVGSGGNIGSGGITDAGGTTDQCGLSPDCLTCLKQYCNSQATDVFGSDYANRNFDGGKCPGIVACSCSEETRDTISDCVQKSNANCVSAFGLLNSCLNAAPCGSACTGKSTGGMGGSVGTGGTTIVSGTGGIIGSGGITGAGGTTVVTSVPACPLGTWTADLGPSGCGDVETIAVITVTLLPSGQYDAAFSVDPVYGFDQGTGQSHCHSMSGTSPATYNDSNRIFTMSGSEPNCPGKAMTLTLTINSDCTQAVTRTVFVGCGICGAPALGCAGGCGSETCISPAGSAVRSTN